MLSLPSFAVDIVMVRGEEKNFLEMEMEQLEQILAFGAPAFIISAHGAHIRSGPLSQCYSSRLDNAFELVPGQYNIKSWSQ